MINPFDSKFIQLAQRKVGSVAVVYPDDKEGLSALLLHLSRP